MSYAENIDRDHVAVNYFVVVGSRSEYPTGGFSGEPGHPNISRTLHSGAHPGILTTSFNGTPNDAIYTLAPSFESVLSPTTDGNTTNAMYYDSKSNRFYVNTSYIINPQATGSVFYLERFYFLSTVHVGFPLKPDDAAYPDVQWHGILNDTPPVSSSVNEVFFGFAPQSSGSISVSNENGYLSSDFFNGSLSNCTFLVYRCVGDLKPENTQLVFKGFTRDCQYQNGNVIINYVDASLLLDSSVGNSRWNNNVQPDLVGAVRREFFCGKHNRVAGVCYLYDATISNSTNRNWSFGSHFQHTNISPKYATYTSADASVASNTSTKTYLDDLTGLQVGMWLTSSHDSFFNVYEITAIGANYIEHNELSSAKVFGTNDYFRLCPIQSISLLHRQSGVVYPLAYSDIQGASTTNVRINNGVEGIYSLPDDICPENYIVFADVVYSLGAINFPSTGAPLGGVNPNTNLYDSPVQLVFELLYRAGFKATADYDTDSFEAAAAACDVRVSLSTPFEFNSFSTETYRTVLARVCETALLKVYLKNGKWSVDIIGPLGDETVAVDSNKMSGNFSYKISSEEVVNQVTARYDHGEVSLINTFSQDSCRTVTKEIVDAQIYNNKYKSLTKDVWVEDETTAQLICDRYAYIFSRPIGYLTVELKLSEIGLSLGDIVSVSADDFTALPFTSEKKFSVVKYTERDGTISVELFDQRGIEDNSEDW